MKKISGIFILLGCVYFSAFSQQPAYKNKNLSPEARAKDLLAKMNLDEKTMQTQCLWIEKFKILNDKGDFDEAKAASLLKNGLGEIARLSEANSPGSAGRNPKVQAVLYNKIKRYFIEKTRLGIPIMVHEESLHGQQTQDATNFPIPMGLASTWNENLMTEIFTKVAEEIRAKGGQHVLMQ